MPFSVSDNEVRLSGHCLVDEAEDLHRALLGVENPMIDLSEALHLHTAIVQLIMAAAGSVRGAPPDRVLAACLLSIPAV